MAAETDSFHGVPSMRNEVKRELSWSKSWIDHIRTIVGKFILRESTLDEDRKEGTDLIVLRAEGVRIACRLRHPGYAQYGQEVTITYLRENGCSCEWNKIIEEDWADWFFYGHATVEEASCGVIYPWHIINLSVLRSGISKLDIVREDWNKDPVGWRCRWRAYNVDHIRTTLGHDAIIASSNAGTPETFAAPPSRPIPLRGIAMLRKMDADRAAERAAHPDAIKKDGHPLAQPASPHMIQCPDPQAVDAARKSGQRRSAILTKLFGKDPHAREKNLLDLMNEPPHGHHPL